MRRKSTRNAKKSPEKAPPLPESPQKTRRSRRRKRSPSKSSESEEEILSVTAAVDEDIPDTTTTTTTTTTKSYTPSDEEPMWKITSSEEAPKGEIQKLKICLTRPVTESSPEKNKSRKSGSSYTEDDATSSEDASTRRTRSSCIHKVEEKKGKGKSKGKIKSKIEKTLYINEPTIKKNSEISENVQVTPQSPTINIRVDNENDYNKADADAKQIVYDEGDQNATLNEIDCILKEAPIESDLFITESNTESLDKPQIDVDHEEKNILQKMEIKDVVENKIEIKKDEETMDITTENEAFYETVNKENSKNKEEDFEPPTKIKMIVTEEVQYDEECKNENKQEVNNSVIINKPVRKKLQRVLIENGSLLTTDKKNLSRKFSFDKTSDPTLIKIDLETIQSICPNNIEFPQEPDLLLETDVKSSIPPTTSASVINNDLKKSERQLSVETCMEDIVVQDNSNIIAFNRKISIVNDTASTLRPPPSPAKNPTSEILFITNLVRPFTIKQLKELLKRTGTFQDVNFWTDKIKSKCFVRYESVEEAEATRNALHGVQWPIGNGKKLIIDYGTQQDFDNAIKPVTPPIVAQQIDVMTKTTPIDQVEIQQLSEKKSIGKMKGNEEFEEKDEKRKDGPVREWDIGKKDLYHRRSRSREQSHKHRRSTSSPTNDFIQRKQRRMEEPIPQKLMDDLFLKTKAAPCIYWQPLSPEEIQTKQQQRLIRMEEHKRRIEENSKFKGREFARPPPLFRRRYD